MGTLASLLSKAPSWVTSTTSLGFLLVVWGAISYAKSHNDTALMVKLVEMIVPSFLTVKGYQMGQNGKKEAANGQTPPVASGTP